MVGDEEVSRISWAEYYQRRVKLQESLNINVGLYALQRCIEALIHRDAAARAGVSIHVPFADSKLTLMLKDATDVRDDDCTTIIVGALRSCAALLRSSLRGAA